MTFWKLFGANNGAGWMWSGPEHGSLNAGVKSSQQTLHYMAEQFQSPWVNRWKEALGKVARWVKGALVSLPNNKLLVWRSRETSKSHHGTNKKSVMPPSPLTCTGVILLNDSFYCLIWGHKTNHFSDILLFLLEGEWIAQKSDYSPLKCQSNKWLHISHQP